MSDRSERQGNGRGYANDGRVAMAALGREGSKGEMGDKDGGGVLEARQWRSYPPTVLQWRGRRGGSMRMGSGALGRPRTTARGGRWNMTRR